MKVMKQKRKRPTSQEEIRARPFKEDAIWQAYEAALAGVSNKGIAKILKTPNGVFTYWLRTKPALRNAVERARRQRGSHNGPPGLAKDTPMTTFTDFVYGRLRPELKAVWDRIIALDATDTLNAEKHLEALMRNQGKAIKQQLWVHALISSNFNASEACRRINIPLQAVTQWAREDAAFGEVLLAMNEAKKDFVEGSLLKLVAAGDSPATIHAAKTLLKDRGYGIKHEVSVEHGGLVAHLHAPVDLATLDTLPHADRVKMLDALQAKRQLPAASATVAVAGEVIAQNLLEED